MFTCETCAAKKGLVHLADGTTMCIRRTWIVIGGDMKAAKMGEQHSFQHNSGEMDKREDCPHFVKQGDGVDPLG